MELGRPTPTDDQIIEYLLSFDDDSMYGVPEWAEHHLSRQMVVVGISMKEFLDDFTKHGRATEGASSNLYNAIMAALKMSFALGAWADRSGYDTDIRAYPVGNGDETEVEVYLHKDDDQIPI